MALCRLHLQIQPFNRTAILLRLHNPFLGRTEVVHLHSHPAFSQGHQTSFCANGTDVGTGKIVLLVDELIKVDIITERHLRSVQGENLLLGVFCGLLVRLIAAG